MRNVKNEKKRRKILKESLEHLIEVFSLSKLCLIGGLGESLQEAINFETS